MQLITLFAFNDFIFSYGENNLFHFPDIIGYLSNLLLCIFLRSVSENLRLSLDDERRINSAADRFCCLGEREIVRSETNRLVSCCCRG